MVSSWLQFTHSTPVESLRRPLIKLYGRVKVIDSKLMVSHVLVNYSSRNKDSLIFRKFLENIRKAFQSLVELISPMVHKAQMEATGYEILRKSQSLFVHIDGFLLQVKNHFIWTSYFFKFI